MPGTDRPSRHGSPPTLEPGPTAPPALATHLLLLASVAIWGSTFVAMKHLVVHLDPIELVGLRFAIGLPVLGVVLAIRRIPLAFDRRDLRPLAVGSAILAVHFLLQPLALSLGRTTATNAGWIISFSPLWIALLSWLVLGERLGARQVSGIAAATTGILLLVSGGSFRGLSWLDSAGDWLMFTTALTWALYTSATRDLARRRGALPVTFVVFAPLTAACLAAMALRSGGTDWSGFVRLPPSATLSLLFLGILGTLAQWFWQLGVARLGAARAGLYVYFQPLATTLLAVLLLGEAFGIPTALGGVLVLAGVFWAQGGLTPSSGGASRARGRSSS